MAQSVNPPNRTDLRQTVVGSRHKGGVRLGRLSARPTLEQSPALLCRNGRPYGAMRFGKLPAWNYPQGRAVTGCALILISSVGAQWGSR